MIIERAYPSNLGILNQVILCFTFQISCNLTIIIELFSLIILRVLLIIVNNTLIYLECQFEWILQIATLCGWRRRHYFHITTILLPLNLLVALIRVLMQYLVHNIELECAAYFTSPDGGHIFKPLSLKQIRMAHKLTQTLLLLIGRQLQIVPAFKLLLLYLCIHSHGIPTLPLCTLHPPPNQQRVPFMLNSLIILTFRIPHRVNFAHGRLIDCMTT